MTGGFVYKNPETGEAKPLRFLDCEKIGILYKIPIRLVSEANKSEHWLKSAKRHTLQKMLVKQYMKAKPCNIDPPWEVDLTRIAPRFLDKEENLPMAFKWIKDAIAEYLCDDDVPGRADSDPRIHWSFYQRREGTKEYACLIEIRSGNLQ